ncbi:MULTISPECIES: (2E,6E)-farnesyl diphosphate synthase [unclassified Arsukibacterium]|uniref:(2E,6E)-farnesyl diphosphate synthase n=1 Tax=unclassified Arsukibacterium TaxID=2635278 RepID=UPI000C8F0F6E|nr:MULTISPECIES: (2E,6E)-farnesyl diphosphate synthase [unclassified Arsukibacterium]MAA93032.1 (2E,6E)-farnesyl diphosphate synthase [Rheinheimera sp.]HAW93843.1 (2E,6E)-farnesyl diphosphate synthase [Candidatus Azambacteria bacterium]
MAPDSLTLYQYRIEQQLQLNMAAQPLTAARLHEAMRYSLTNGGKRIRPYLVYSCGTMLGVSLDTLDSAACAIECLHSYSLIHDDLPAMDNDDLRRGKPTCHKAYDEATAILAGDALQALAFDILASAEGELSVQRRLKRVALLAKASGIAGMCAGQAIDLAQTNQRTDLATLEQMHRLKTGALIECAVQLAYYSSELDCPATLQALTDFASALGLAFQVQDDILDIESDTTVLGKPQGSDSKANKLTYPALLGLQEAKAKAHQLYQEALAALVSLPYNTDELQAFAHYIIARKF